MFAKANGAPIFSAIDIAGVWAHCAKNAASNCVFVAVLNRASDSSYQADDDVVERVRSGGNTEAASYEEHRKKGAGDETKQKTVDRKRVALGANVVGQRKE